MNKPTIILGASPKPERYSYKALEMLTENGHTVIPIAKRKNTALNTSILDEPIMLQHIDTITLYLNPARQEEYYEYILSTKPARVIFNPGTENPALFTLCQESGIEPLEACTLVLLRLNDY